MIGNLRRTQIYLQESQMLLLRERAHASRVHVSELIRDAVDRYLEADSAVVLGDDPIDELIGKIDMSPPDLSRRVDDYLYGTSKSRPGKRPKR